MDILVKVLQLILSLSILVLFHEFGHFLFAKLFKTRVEKFYMFFNPWFSLFKFRRGETEYGMGWLPLGGYVKIAGMIDESMDTEQMKNPPQPWEFRAKPAWQRLLIMLGGVLVNVVLAFVIFILVLYTWGETYLPADNVKYGVISELVFKDMGIRNGDRIVALDGRKVEDFFDIVPDILLNDPKTIEVEREGVRIVLPVPESLVAELVRISSVKNFRAASLLTPRQLMDSTVVREFAEYSAAYDAGVRAGDRILAINGVHSRFYDEFTGLLGALKGENIELALLRGRDTLQIPMQLGSDGKLGIYFANTDQLEFAVREYTFAAAVPAGIKKGAATLKSYVKQLKLLFTPQVKAYKSVGGVMSMGNIFPGVWDWQVFWELTAFISIMLAVVNILPIPALDGGHVLFLLYEVITRRKPGEKFLEYAQVIGMLFLIALFILVNVNDVVRFFG